jgi:carbamoyl-phosphate synthase large subunit
MSAQPVPWSESRPGRRPGRGALPALTTIVTGAGGPAGVAVGRALRSAGIGVVAVDADPSAVGLRLADDAAVVPAGGSVGAISQLVELAHRTGAAALVSTVAEELHWLSDAAADLRRAGVRTWLPTREAAARCVDKWRFHAALQGVDVAVPPTGLGSAEGIAGPWIVKPRFGRGSRDVYAVDDPDELPWVLRRVPDPLVQTRVTGREFTVDALVDRDGELSGAVARWRHEVKAGISTKGSTFHSRDVTDGVATVLAAVGLHGPANVQGFVAGDGTPWFIEVNPRFSGGLPLSLAAGADLVGEYLRGVIGLPVRPERLHYRSGVTMLRHFEEVIEG